MRKKTKTNPARDALVSKAIIGLQIPIMSLGDISNQAQALLEIPGDDDARVTLLRAFAKSRGATEA